MVEMVERVAEKVEEAADDVGDSLPDGKLKAIVELVENIAKDAHLTDQLIEKVTCLIYIIS